MHLCVPTVSVMFMCTCRCERRWISRGLTTDVSASPPVFEDGIKACDEKVRNVRNTANSEREKKTSASFWNKTIIDLFGQASLLHAFFFANLGFFFLPLFFPPPPSRPKRLCSMIYGEGLSSEAAAQTSGGLKAACWRYTCIKYSPPSPRSLAPFKGR